MSQLELLTRVVEALAAAGIDYMVTGSVASSMQGAPRSTHDVDLVVAMKPEAVAHLVEAFPPPDYYLTEEAIQDAIRGRSMFNLLSLNDGTKADFWMLTDEPFDQSRFARKWVADVFGMRLPVSAPEDTILVKLRWALLSGGSEKQVSDAQRVYQVQREKLDEEYVNRWAKELGVEDLWQRLRSESGGKVEG
jgi:hypothetical protein